MVVIISIINTAVSIAKSIPYSLVEPEFATVKDRLNSSLEGILKIAGGLSKQAHLCRPCALVNFALGGQYFYYQSCCAIHHLYQL